MENFHSILGGLEFATIYYLAANFLTESLLFCYIVEKDSVWENSAYLRFAVKEHQCLRVETNSKTRCLISIFEKFWKITKWKESQIVNLMIGNA